ncbi:MAG TPA: Na+/H+ antiporter [Bryobacteraceae bacterium]|jgi:CPA1 family monovalent cation:H+ antiporter|nr:Na+/H+ antiporter [Bryobacteraceae bacterium]
MESTSFSHVQLLLLGLLGIVAALAVMARRLQIPYPIVMVIGGVALSVVPGLPRVSLDPNLVFFVILPPLIFSAAFHISWREFRNNMVAILMLAFGLVAFTVYAVAVFARWTLPNFDWKLGLVLGAVIAATDPLSATATARRLGIPRKITDLLEAESLVNDGSGLVALNFTAALVVTGYTPSFVMGVGELCYLIAAAVAIGLAAGFLVHKIQQRITDAPVEITLSLITPYLSYLCAEAAHCSGILATLACGLYLGRRSSGFFSLHARIESRAVWRTLDFMLNGIVFLLLGLQLPYILMDIRGVSPGQIILHAALFSSAVIAIRLIWVYPGAWISGFIRKRLHQKRPSFNKRELFVVGWSGMRGVLGLAAALSLPETLHNGTRFPERNTIIFLTFSAIFATLVLQGLSLPFIIRRLGLGGAETAEHEEAEARREMLRGALDELDRIKEENGGAFSEIEAQMQHYYRQRLAMLRNHANGDGSAPVSSSEYELIGQRLRAVERSIALKLRDENKIHDEILRSLERELDLLDARVPEREF